MKVIELYNQVQKRLKAGAAGGNGQAEADLVFRYRLGLTPTQRFMFAQGEIGPRALAGVEDAVLSCEQGLPLAYALGRADFAGLTFRVTPDVLIPRADTEWLVKRGHEWILEQQNQNLTLLDLGCGSGCIGITLAVRHPQLRIVLADVSEPALDVARSNARRHGVADRCMFHSGDWYSWARRRERFNAILCNPPYVTRRNDPALEEAVKQHEPSLALFLNDDPQEFFFRLARKSVTHLVSGGLFAVEVGYDTAWEAKCAIDKVKALSRGKEIHDFAGIERVIWGIRR